MLTQIYYTKYIHFWFYYQRILKIIYSMSENLMRVRKKSHKNFSENAAIRTSKPEPDQIELL